MLRPPSDSPAQTQISRKSKGESIFVCSLLWLLITLDLQPAGMISRRAAILSPLFHTHRGLPQALAAQRLHGQMWQTQIHGRL